MTDLADRLRDGQLAVFLFHGVIERVNAAVRNYTGKHLEAARFRSIVESLTRAGQALSMDEVVEHWTARRALPPRAFAISFDDGFENNFSVAVPILRELRVPATFYVTTSFVEGNRMSWVDRIERCLETVPAGAVQLPWHGSPRPFGDDAGKIALLQDIRTRAKSDPRVDPEALADEVVTQCGVEIPHSSDDPLDRKLTWEQVRALAADPLFAVGGHSHTHRVLSFLDRRELRAEIDTSLELLALRAGVRPRHYSYPEGLEWCYSDSVIAALRRRGVVCCPTAVDGLNTLDDDLFRLKRIAVTE